MSKGVQVQNNECPKIRFVESFPVDTENGQMVGLRDPHGISSEMLLLSPDIAYMLRFFDGRHSAIQLRSKYLRIFGNQLYAEQLTEIVKTLDAHFYLDNHNFETRLKSIRQDFLDMPVRPAVHAGQSYESDPDNLKAQLHDFFKKPKGPGIPRITTSQKQIKALVAPHIDIRAGGTCYAHAYKALMESAGADCFVILGTGHSGLTNLYSILEKDFETPLGRARCDLDFIKQLKSRYDNFDQFDLLAHKTEHTIEFQLVFLQYLLQEKRDFTFVPILCSFSYHLLDQKNFQREAQIVQDFSRALKETIAQFDKRVCLIASVDLSHVGPQYGDEQAPDKAAMAEVNQADQALIAYTAKHDSEKLYHEFQDNQDRFRVCGFSPLYTMLQSLEQAEGRLLDYAKTTVDAKNSTVTFASMVFE